MFGQRLSGTFCNLLWFFARPSRGHGGEAPRRQPATARCAGLPGNPSRSKICTGKRPRWAHAPGAHEASIAADCCYRPNSFISHAFAANGSSAPVTSARALQEGAVECNKGRLQSSESTAVHLLNAFACTLSESGAAEPAVAAGFTNLRSL